MTKENIQEVNETEVITPEVDETEDTDDEIDTDKIIVPPLEEKPTEEDVEQLKSVTSEEKIEEENTEIEKIDEIPALKQSKPVEGETPRERALRIQIQELREKVRAKDEIIKISPTPISNEEYEKLKEVYNDDELDKFEKLFDVIGRKKGYVKAEEIYTKDGNDVLEQFIEKHPEYKPENDPDDVRWNTFKRILTNDYNRAGKQPKELARLFDKVNRDVLEEFGESAKTIIKPNERNAEILKVKSVSHAGGTKTEIAKKSNAPTDPTVRKMFKDFDDEDF
jgi:hypothetical protein